MSDQNDVGSPEMPQPSCSRESYEPSSLAESCHDYEPRLEFDDEVEFPSPPGPSADAFLPHLEFSFTFDDTPNFVSPYTPIDAMEFLLEQSGLLRIFGTDGEGRQLIAMYACKLPHNTKYTTQSLFHYLVNTLDQYVQQDYIIIYFHYGLTKENKPPMSWFWETYKLLDRKFKKNLKALYVVHPTNVIKTLWILMKPFISVKFGKKIKYFNYIHELASYVKLDTIDIPTCVLEYDIAVSKDNAEAAKEVPITQQFKVSLSHIVENNPRCTNYTPPAVQECIEFLLQGNNLMQRGIFRRCGSHHNMVRLKAQADAGQRMDLDSPFTAAAMLKLFFHELEQPIICSSLYEKVVNFGKTYANIRDEDKPISANAATLMILVHLPVANYALLNVLIEFLEKVDAEQEHNGMCAANLARIFAPTLLWKTDMSDYLKDSDNIMLFLEIIFSYRTIAFDIPERG